MRSSKLSAALLVAAAISCAVAWKCSYEEGRELVNTLGKRVAVNIQCKFHAIHAQKCGEYKVFVTPGNSLDPFGKQYMSTMFFGVAKLKDDRYKWSGTLNYKLVDAYLHGKSDYPYRRLVVSHDFNIHDVGKWSNDTDEKKGPGVKFTAKDFTLRYGNYEQDGRQEKTSGFEFECTAAGKKSQVKPFNESLCGSGTLENPDAFALRQRTMKMRRKYDFSENEWTFAHTIVFETLNFEKTAQLQYKDAISDLDQDDEYNCTCKTMETLFHDKCQSEKDQVKAVQRCYEIQQNKRLRQCFVKHPDSPDASTVMWWCLGYYCSGRKVEPFCPHLNLALDHCTHLGAMQQDLVDETEEDCPILVNETEVCSSRRR